MATREIMDLIKNHDTDLNRWGNAAHRMEADSEMLDAITQSNRADVWATIRAFSSMRERIKMEFQAGQVVYPGKDPRQEQLTWAADAIRAILADFQSAGFSEADGPLY
jgi:hypothetical protein